MCFRIFFLVLIALPSLGSDPYPRNQQIDIRHYRFELELADSTNAISGKATVVVAFKAPVASFALDLISLNENGTGMVVTKVEAEGQSLFFRHQNDRLEIQTNDLASVREISFEIYYHGIPRDGLIIGINKFNERTFFGDNWPNRGRHWLPSIDHPYDKASVDFVVTAPERYQVVATGRQVEETNLTRQRKRTHYSEPAPVALKVMTIGVARFAVQLAGEWEHTPISTWVYPQNREDGFYDFAVAPRIFEFLEQYIGPYSYQKLAHVQSKTRFGGLENAGNIFYFENSVTGKNERESLIAHETAHQWFGNSATENDWHHVWLSEGFATYFAALYFEHSYGPDRLARELKEDRTQVLAYYEENKAPIVDTTITEVNRVLNTNTYQKASWVLHMLRQEMGDTAFKATIREYYARYQNSNAVTADFQKIAEKRAGHSLTTFFNQWLWRGGFPDLKLTWQYNREKKEVVIMYEQLQSEPAFDVKLELELIDGRQTEVKTLVLSKKSGQLSVPTNLYPHKVTADPATKLLFRAVLQEKIE